MALRTLYHLSLPAVHSEPVYGVVVGTRGLRVAFFSLIPPPLPRGPPCVCPAFRNPSQSWTSAVFGSQQRASKRGTSPLHSTAQCSQQCYNNTSAQSLLEHHSALGLMQEYHGSDMCSSTFPPSLCQCKIFAHSKQTQSNWKN